MRGGEREEFIGISGGGLGGIVHKGAQNGNVIWKNCQAKCFC